MTPIDLFFHRTLFCLSWELHEPAVLGAPTTSAPQSNRNKRRSLPGTADKHWLDAGPTCPTLVPRRANAWFSSCVVKGLWQWQTQPSLPPVTDPHQAIAHLMPQLIFLLRLSPVQREIVVMAFNPYVLIPATVPRLLWMSRHHTSTLRLYLLPVKLVCAICQIFTQSNFIEYGRDYLN